MFKNHDLMKSPYTMTHENELYLRYIYRIKYHVSLYFIRMINDPKTMVFAYFLTLE